MRSIEPSASQRTESEEDSDGSSVDRPLDRIRYVLPTLGAVAMGSWVFLAIVHVGDRYEVGWVMGARMSLARSFANGTLYPPLFDGRSFGGTRFMPIPLMLHGWLAKATGEYVVSGKLLAYGSFAFLSIVTYWALRRVSCSRSISFGLTSLVVLTGAGLVQASSFYADALPVALQLTALNMIGRTRVRRATIGAAGLSAAALFTKTSAVWAPLAIASWFWRRDRSTLKAYAAMYIGTSLALLAVFEVASQGRFLVNILGLTLAEHRDPSRLLWWPFFMFARDVTALGVVAFGIVGTIVAMNRREATLYHHAFVWASLVLTVVLTDPGTQANHTIDVIVLATVVTGFLWARAPTSTPQGRTMRVGMAVVVSLTMLISLATRIEPRLTYAISTVLHGAPDRRFALQPLRPYVHRGESILSEDPTIPILMNERPTVLDAWMFRVIGQRHPDWIQELVARIDDRGFDAIVLLARLGTQPRGWYTDVHFGHSVIMAIKRNYTFEVTRDGYSIYIPNPSDTWLGSSDPQRGVLGWPLQLSQSRQ